MNGAACLLEQLGPPAPHWLPRTQTSQLAHLPSLFSLVHPLQEVPGRIWEGKEAVLDAVGTLCTSCAASLVPPQRTRLVAALLDAASKKRAAYRKEGMVQLEAALLAFAGGSGGSSGTASASASGAAAEGNGAVAGEPAGKTGGFYSLVAPPMLELATQYVEAAQGSASMETDQASGQQVPGQQAQEESGGGSEPHPGKAVPAAQVAACLGAAFATTSPSAARQHADAVAAALSALLGAVGKPVDQVAVVAAACRLAEHAAKASNGGGVDAGGGEPALAPPVLSPGQPGVAALLQGALRLAEEGKAAQLREQCYRLR